MRHGHTLALAHVFSLSIGMLAAACGDSTTVATVSGPTSARCTTTAAAEPRTVPHDGGSVTVRVSAARDCTWTAASDAAWIQLPVTSGQGEASFTGTVARNDDTAPRTGAIVVNEQRVTLQQDPRPCTFALGAQRVGVPGGGGSRSVEVTTLGGCTWSASSGAAWIRLIAGSGTGSGQLEFDVAANDGDAREAVVTVSDLRLVVSQDAAAPVCTYAIRPSASAVGARGGEGRFRVDTQSACGWSASTSVSWIVVSGGGQSGAGDVSYTVLTNPTTSTRSGTIAAGGQSHVVTQEGAARSCSYAVSPSSQQVPASGGQFRFQVSAEASCAWSASSGASWVTVNTGGNYGLGTADVWYAVQPNQTRSARSTTLSVGGQTHTVNQAAAP